MMKVMGLKFDLGTFSSTTTLPMTILIVRYGEKEIEIPCVIEGLVFLICLGIIFALNYFGVFNIMFPDGTVCLV